MRFDPTINIPTIIALATLTVTVTGFGVGLYSTLDKRQMASEFALVSQSARIDKIETSLVKLQADQAAQNTVLRTETKADIREIKDLFDRFVYPGPRAPQSRLKEWSK